MGLINLIKRQKRKLTEIDDIIRYPLPEDLSELVLRRGLRSAPKWIRTDVREIKLDSGETAVYSVILSQAILPEQYSIEIEGYKLNRKKVKRFPEEREKDVISEVREKLESKYNVKDFDRISCIN